jgi:uncharacterized protein DUF4936
MAGRELFVWYRVRRDHIDEAGAIVGAMQGALRSAWPGLRTGWLVRDDGDAAAPTWMETYARDRVDAAGAGGIGGTLEAAIAAASQRLQPALDGPRHVEAFERRS